MAEDIIVRAAADDWAESLPKRLLNHPTPLACAPHQRYACEQPENPDVHMVLWHSNCSGCMIALQAAMANQEIVLMAHGSTFKTYRMVTDDGG